MNKSIIFVCVFVLTSIMFSQISPPEIQWSITLGGSADDKATAIDITPYGEIIIAGKTNSNDFDVSGNHGDSDSWLMKFSSYGLLRWEECFGGSNYDIFYSVQYTSDRHILTGGKTKSINGDVSGNNGRMDFWVTKHTTDGEMVWQTCLGGNGDDWGWCAQETEDGCVVVGTSTSTDGDVTVNHGDDDIWVARIDTDGEIIWQRSLGGSDREEVWMIRTTSDGGFIIPGVTNSSDCDVTDSHGGIDFWIIKLASNGTILWKKSYGGSRDDNTRAIEQTSDGGYIVVGHTDSRDGDVGSDLLGSWDVWVLKLDPDGEIEWERNYGGSLREKAYGVCETSDGGYAITGYTESTDGIFTENNGELDLFVFKIDSDGEFLWSKTIGGLLRDMGMAIRQTDDNGYVIAARTQSDDFDLEENYGGYDLWALKLSPDDAISSERPKPEQIQINTYPNPFNSKLNIDVPEDCSKISILSVDGSLVTELERLNSFTWDASNMPSGEYLIKIDTPRYSTTRKVMLIK